MYGGTRVTYNPHVDKTGVRFFDEDGMPALVIPICDEHGTTVADLRFDTVDAALAFSLALRVQVLARQAGVCITEPTDSERVEFWRETVLAREEALQQAVTR